MIKIFEASTMIVAYLVISVIMAAVIVWRETPKGNEMATLDILTALVKGGMSPVGACAMGGYMMAESGMKANNLQDSYQKKLGYTDDSYTSSVDSGNYTRTQFLADEAGYGICQWTWHTRKAALYDFAKKNGKSIGDEDMQVQFCIAELKTDYPTLWKFLCETHDAYTATERICKEYEQPAVNNIETRYKYARQLYKDYGETIAAGASPRPTEGNVDREPESYIMGTVRSGEHSPEACFLMSHLVRLGYDVLWLGLDACLKDFQQKHGLEVDGVCGEKTWGELMK